MKVPSIRHLAVVCFLFAVFTTAAGAELLHADFADGDCLLRTESGWIPLVSGDRIAADAVIRLGPGALLEIGGKTLRLSIAKEGIYDLAHTVKNARARRAWNPDRILSNPVLKQVRAPDRRVETVMGVRAERQQASGDGALPWMEEDDPELLVRQGAAALDAGRIGEAIALFDDAVAEIDDPDPPGTRIMIAGHWMRQGMSALALRYLTPAEVDESHPRFGEFSLLTARLLLEIGSFAEVLELLEGAIPRLESVPDAQAAWILLAMAQHGLDSLADARESLDRARSLDPDSTLANEAEELIGRL